MANERHEKALEASVAEFASTSLDTDDAALVIKAYLRAMDAVIVPREPCLEMINIYRENVKPRPFYRTAARVIREMIYAVPNHFTNGE